MSIESMRTEAAMEPRIIQQQPHTSQRTRVIQKINAMQVSLLLLVITAFAPGVQSLQPANFAKRGQTLPVQGQFHRGAALNTRHGVHLHLLSRSNQHHRRRNLHRGRSVLFEKTKGEGHGKPKHVSLKQQHQHHSSIVAGGRRARLRNRMSNIWSTLRTNKEDRQALEDATTSTATLPSPEEVVEELETENMLLRETVLQLELENDRLSKQRKVVLESFEGEGSLFLEAQEGMNGRSNKKSYEDDLMEFGITLSGEELAGDSNTFTPPSDKDAALWCDELEEDMCPVEPQISFSAALRDRAYWLVGLLVMQSCSGFILSRNEALLANHPVIIYFLTMLVGAGGNAGNQASVRVIRGLALGTLNERTQAQFLNREFKMAVALSGILSLAGFLRAAAFRTPFPETIAVTASLSLIVLTSVCLGAILPILLQKMGVDPAHSSTTIQVIMDILGVLVAVAISSLVLDSPLGVMLVSRLGG